MKNKLAWLIGASAFTLSAQYALQGWLAVGKSPSDLGAWFWVIDAALWVARALIEAFVIFYLFATPRQTWLVKAFEIALISLVTATLGPVIAATSQGGIIQATLHPIAFWVWCFLIASYVPLMIGAAGVAYRIRQGGDSKEIVTGSIVKVEDRPRTEVVRVETQPRTLAEQIVHLENTTDLNRTQIAEHLDISRTKLYDVLRGANNGPTD